MSIQTINHRLKAPTFCLLAAMMLSGCSKTISDIFPSSFNRGSQSSQLSNNNGSASVTKPSSSSVKLAAKQDTVRAQTLNVEISYRERLHIPAGSMLSVTLQGTSGSKNVLNTPIKSGPPYVVKIKLNKDQLYPVTVKAKLVSTNGHQLAGDVTLNSAPSKPVPLRVSTAI
ncbi:MAG: hypothetical protein AAF423_11760 [Pseudomonadota bacterium]